MKRILLLMFIVTSQLGFSQVDLSFFKTSLLLSTYDSLETNMMNSGYRYDESTIASSGKACFADDIFKRVNSIYSETISVISECSEDERKPSKKIEFITSDKKLFYKIKNECKNIKTIIPLTDTFKDETVRNKYADGNFTYTFISGKYRGRKYYKFEVEYDRVIK